MSLGVTITGGFRAMVVAAIVGYQRWVSPHKGYCCARRAARGGLSCSEYGKRVVGRCEPAQWWRLMRRRFAACAMAAAQLRQRPLRVPPMNQTRRDGGCAAVSCCLDVPAGACCVLG